jgi:hypothetical protein
VIRKRSDYWQVKVYAGRDLLTGKERYEYDRARTKREAERVEAALKTKVAEGRHRSTAARTVADLVERWYEWRQGVKEISPTTLEGTVALAAPASERRDWRHENPPPSPHASPSICLRQLPFPTRRDRARGPLVPPLWPVLP